MSFGVESLVTGDAQEVRAGGRSRRAHQRQIMEHCREAGHRHRGVLRARIPPGRLELHRGATIDYATDLGSTFAQFKILTPYPGTPMFKQLEPLLTETRLGEVRRLHADVPPPEPDGRASSGSCSGAAYKRFYMRPSCLANLS